VSQTSLETALDQLAFHLMRRAERCRRGVPPPAGSTAALLRLADVAALTTQAPALRDECVRHSRERLLDAVAMLQEHAA
jgi:hypothetical protein